VQLLTKAWAAEFAGRGVRVNAVSPGPTRNEGTEVMGDGIDQMAATTPSGIVASPDDIADGILFFSSPRIPRSTSTVQCCLSTAGPWPSDADDNPYGVGIPPLTCRVSPMTKLDSPDARNT
jgi:NAD(P)-dependent dehydrogenase (short-subunit alcohol dehydrogenase family)